MYKQYLRGVCMKICYKKLWMLLIQKDEAGTKPPSQTKKGLEFEFFLKFQSFYFA